MVNLKKRCGEKFHRIILLHLGLVTFLFAYGRNLKPLKSMIWGFLDVPLGPKTNIYLLRHQDASNNPRKVLNHFRKISLFVHVESWEIDTFILLEETGTEQ